MNRRQRTARKVVCWLWDHEPGEKFEPAPDDVFQGLAPRYIAGYTVTSCTRCGADLGRTASAFHHADLATASTQGRAPS